LGKVPTTPHHKNLTGYKTFHKDSGLDWYFGRILAQDNGHEICNMECEKPVQARVTEDGGHRIIKIQIRFKGSMGGLMEQGRH
jgi:hypothetical protein